MLFLTPEESRNLIDHVIDRAWPVGSVFVSVVTTNPAELFGIGVWQEIGAGRVLVGQDASQLEFDALEKTGGAKEVTLDVTQMPAHTHVENSNNTTTGSLRGWGAPDVSTNQSTPTGYITGSTGGDQPHTNLQPYLVVKFWKRVN